jgi:hypothetical protein
MITNFQPEELHPEGKRGTATITRDGDQWFVLIVYEVKVTEPKAASRLAESAGLITLPGAEDPGPAAAAQRLIH